MQGVITVGQLSCFLTYANQYTKPFNEISSVLTEIQNAFACAKRVFDFIDEEVETKDKEGALILQQTDGISPDRNPINKVLIEVVAPTAARAASATSSAGATSST